jgi:hypothetical protein
MARLNRLSGRRGLCPAFIDQTSRAKGFIRFANLKYYSPFNPGQQPLSAHIVKGIRDTQWDFSSIRFGEPAARPGFQPV